MNSTQTRGLTAKRLADAAGWHPSKVSKIEHGTTTPSAGDIRAWCQHTGIPEAVDDLVASLRSIESMFVEWRRIERRGLRRAAPTQCAIDGR